MVFALPPRLRWFFSVVALCAALIGCSSSDDGKSAELERQLDVEKAALMTAQEEVASLRAQVQALMGRPDITPQALQDLRDQVAELSGRADITDQDLQALGAQLEALTLELEATRHDLETAERGAAADMVTGGVATAAHATASGSYWGPNSGQPVYSNDNVTFSMRHPTFGQAWNTAPWMNADGDLEFFIDIGTYGEGHEIQTTPVDVYSGRLIDTTRIGNDRPGTSTTTRELEHHGLGPNWQGMRAEKKYEADGGGRLVVEYYTDADASDNLARPNVRDDFPHEITLDDVGDLPADRDYQYFVRFPDGGLHGTLDGVPGQFTCAPNFPWCGAGGPPVGHHDPDRIGPNTDVTLIFAPDDGSAPTEIPAGITKARSVPAADYLSLGNWRYVPWDLTGGDFEFGAFATVGEPFGAANLMALQGVARYAGRSRGVYAISYDVDGFDADVEFDADFGTAADFGTVTGRVFNIALDSGSEAPIDEIELSSRAWADESGAQNIFPASAWSWLRDPEALADGGKTTGSARFGDWSVNWGAVFGGNGDAVTDPPSSLAGTFAARRLHAMPGNHRVESFTGSFGAYKED